MGETFDMGDKVHDSVTAYAGTVTARAEYLNGSTRIQVSKTDDRGKLIETWFDEGRLESDA